MNKKFTKSILTAIAGLGLISSCTMMGMEKDSHKCASKKKEESNKCGAAHGCASKKTETSETVTKKKVK